MVKRALACSVEIDVHSVACPGVWLPKRDAIYLVIHLFGQVCRTKVARPIFPIRYNEKCRFKKVFSSSCELSQVAELLEGMIITIKLMQVESSFGLLENAEDEMLAYHQSNASSFLYPSAFLCPNTKERRLLLHRTICFPGENPIMEFASTAIIHETMIPAGKLWECGANCALDVCGPLIRSPIESTFVRYSRPISPFRTARDCKECGRGGVDHEECFSDVERKVSCSKPRKTKTKRMKSQSTLLRPCSSLCFHDNFALKSMTPCQRLSCQAQASRSEPRQRSCTCDSEEEAFSKRSRRKTTGKYEHLRKSNDVRSPPKCYDCRAGLLRKLLEKLSSGRPATSERPPFVIRKVESKEFRRKPGLSDISNPDIEERRLREMMVYPRESRQRETLSPSKTAASPFDQLRERLLQRSMLSTDGLYGSSLSKDCPICQAYLKYLGKPYLGHLHDDDDGKRSKDCPEKLHGRSKQKKFRRVEFDEIFCPDDRRYFRRSTPTSRSTQTRVMGTPERTCPCDSSLYIREESCENDDRDSQFVHRRRSPKVSRKSFGPPNGATSNDAYATPDTTDLLFESSFNSSPYKMPDCSTAARNCYASDPPWITDSYHESRRSSGRGLQPSSRYGSPPVFLNDSHLHKHSDKTSRRHTERLVCGSLDAANSSQLPPRDARGIPPRPSEDSRCTFVTPSIATGNITGESADRFLESLSFSRGNGSFRAGEKSFQTAASYSTTGRDHRRSAVAKSIYVAPAKYSPVSDINYNVVGSRDVVATDDLSKDSFVPTLLSPKSQFAASVEDRVAPHNLPVARDGSVVPSHVSPVDQHVASNSFSKRRRSRKSSNGQFVASFPEQFFPNQTSVWVDGSREISQILPTGQQHTTSNHMSFIRDVFPQKSPTGQYVTFGIDAVAPNSFSMSANGAGVASPCDQPLGSSNFSRRRRRSHRSSRTSWKCRCVDCSFDQVVRDNFSLTRDVSYVPSQASPVGQYLISSLNQVPQDNFSPTAGGSHMPSQASPMYHHVTSSRNQVAADNVSLRIDASQASSQMLPKYRHVASSAEPMAPDNIPASSYMSPQIQRMAPNEFSVTGDVSCLPSHVSSKYRYVTSAVDQVAPSDFSKDGFQMSSEMSSSNKYAASSVEPTIPDNFIESSFTSPEVQYVALSVTRDGCRVPSHQRSPKNLYLASESREPSSFATPQIQYATPNNLSMTRSSLRSFSQMPSPNQYSRSYVERLPSRVSYSGSAYIETTSPAPTYFQHPPSSTEPCMRSEAAPSSFYAPPSITSRRVAYAGQDQISYEVPRIPRRHKRQNTFSGNPWLICSTKEASTFEDSSRNFIQPTVTYNPCATPTINYINSSAAFSVPQGSVAPSSGFQGFPHSSSTPQNLSYAKNLPRGSHAVNKSTDSLPASSTEPVNLPNGTNDRISLATQDNRYGTLTSLEMARDPTQTTAESISHAISVDGSALVQRVPHSFSAVPDGSFVVANDTTIVASPATPATSTPRQSREAARISRMFGDESSIPKDEPDKNSPTTGRRQGKQPTVVRALNFDDHPVSSLVYRNSSPKAGKPKHTNESLKLSTSPPNLSTGPLNDSDSAILESPTRISENKQKIRSNDASDPPKRRQTVGAEDERIQGSFESSHRQKLSSDSSTLEGGRLSSTEAAGTGQTKAYSSLQVETDPTKFPALEEMSIVDVWGPLRYPHAEMVSIHQEQVPADSDREDLTDIFRRSSPKVRSPEKKTEES